MASRGDFFPAGHAITCFRAQTYPHRELIVACAGPGSAVEAYITALADPAIRFVDARGADTVGEIRNRALAAAAGTLACIWDDDDLYHPRRLDWQVAGLIALDADACFLNQLLLWWPARRCLAVSAERIWENTMLARISALPAYQAMQRGSDSALVTRLLDTAPLAVIARPGAYCYVAHGGNLWGEDHFEMLFDHAVRHYAGADYDEGIRTLLGATPAAAYARDLHGLGARTSPR